MPLATLIPTRSSCEGALRDLLDVFTEPVNTLSERRALAKHIPSAV